jgi:hypothetical protein
VVEHSAHNPKVGDLNPVTGMDREIMATMDQRSSLLTEFFTVVKGL